VPEPQQSAGYLLTLTKLLGDAADPQLITSQSYTTHARVKTGKNSSKRSKIHTMGSATKFSFTAGVLAPTLLKHTQNGRELQSCTDKP
jgi:hypothetical protein